MVGTFGYCQKMGSNITILAPNVTLMRNMLVVKNNNIRINIIVPYGSTTRTTAMNTSASYSLVGKAITWTTDATNTYSYNKTYNIYIYQNKGE